MLANLIPYGFLASFNGAEGGLREQGQCNNFVASSSFELLQRMGYRRIAIAHANLAQGIDACLGKAFVQRIALSARFNRKRGTVGRPYLLVARRCFLRPGSGNEETQDGLPDGWRNLDYVSVGKKFDQVRANVPRLGGVGRTRIYENNACLFFLENHNWDYSKSMC